MEAFNAHRVLGLESCRDDPGDELLDVKISDGSVLIVKGLLAEASSAFSFNHSFMKNYTEGSNQQITSLSKGTFLSKFYYSILDSSSRAK